MTTCPNCKRPFLTAAEWDALPDGALVPGDRCRSDAGYDWSCDRLGVDLRAKADAALLAAARKLPRGVLARIVAVLEHGAAKYGCAVDATGGGQSALDHLLHAEAHIRRAKLRGEFNTRDAETGRLDLDHAAARLVLAMGEVGE